MPAQGCEGGRELCVFSHTSPFTAQTLVSERVEQGEQRFRLREAGAVSWARGLCTATHRGAACRVCASGQLQRVGVSGGPGAPEEQRAVTVTPWAGVRAERSALSCRRAGPAPRARSGSDGELRKYLL